MVHRLSAPLLAMFAIGISASGAGAQSVAPRHRGHVPQQRAEIVTDGAPVTYRGLTINRTPQGIPVPDDQDIYQDGPVRYNDIRDFSPSPYTTSGVQYPFGLDGIGGYGSGLEVGSGEDSALYDRGAGTRP